MLPRGEYKALITLQKTPGLGNQLLRQLLSKFGTGENVINTPLKSLLDLSFLNKSVAKSIKEISDYSEAESILNECEKRSIQLISITEESYPFRLKQISDAPIVLYYKGNLRFNHPKTLGIVGTRNITPHGQIQLQKIMQGFLGLDIQIISGLAIGTDGLAHKIALDQGMETVGVLANGLAYVYPDSHKDIAVKMTDQGGLISEFAPTVDAEPYYFPQRNRIIAGLSDAVLVIESGHKGGSMITAKLAFDYNRDLFAVPGRVADYYSQGCLELIKTDRANMCTEASDILKIMNWSEKTADYGNQLSLYEDLTDLEKQVIDSFEKDSELHFEKLFGRTGLPSSSLLSTLLSLELKGLIKSSPGQLYSKT